MQLKRRHKKIEQALKRKFPGWRVKFWIKGNKFEIETHKLSKREFYHLYPHLPKKEADMQFITDVMSIIHKYYPHAEGTTQI